MDVIEIDGARALALLREAVAEAGPENTYHHEDGQAANVNPYLTCHYVHNPDTTPEPGCIVGRALHLAGMPLDAVAQLDCRTHSGPDGLGDFTPHGVAAGPADAIRHPMMSLHADAHSVFVAAQQRQDNGETYGTALKAAENVADGLGLALA